MSVNSNPTASQQSKKKLDTDDQPLLSNISANFRKNFKWPQLGYSGAWGKQIHEKSLKSKKSRVRLPFSS